MSSEIKLVMEGRIVDMDAEQLLLAIGEEDELDAHDMPTEPAAVRDLRVYLQDHIRATAGSPPWPDDLFKRGHVWDLPYPV